MPPSSRAPAVDKAFCERTCRVATALGWRLEEERVGEAYAYKFHAPNGRLVCGHAFDDSAAALTHACRVLAEKLV